ncbi:hypothetical protein [Agrobacterium pusense]|uniref:hypothetical protein n=1 Tax=Agrobacterium pusense TaxID=648995 RepID=UPI0032DABFCE
MKPEKKPFVVEFKNRRRLPRKEASIWGRIDLKAASDVVEVEQMGTEAASMTHGQSTESEATPTPAGIGA